MNSSTTVAARGQPHRDAIVLRDEVLDGEVDIGQRRVDALGGGAELGASVIGEAEGVRDEVGSHELVDRLELALAEDLVDESLDEALVLIGAHGDRQCRRAATARARIVRKDRTI